MVNSLLKNGLIGMGFSYYCFYLLYKYKVQDCGEWNHMGIGRIDPRLLKMKDLRGSQDWNECIPVIILK